MKGKKILVIEPDFDSLKSLSRFLLDAKFDVITAYDGEEGLMKAKTENPDLIILEPRLPKMDGFNLCSIITKDFDRKIPVIILTEFFQDFKAEILHSFGAAAYLKKPVDKEKLLCTILGLLKERGEERIVEETKSFEPIVKPYSDASREKLELKSKNNGSNGKNGNGHYRQLENILSSYTFDVGSNLRASQGHRSNGTRKKKGRAFHQTIKIDSLLEEVMSEFGLASKKKTSLQEDIHALNDLIASR